MRTLTYLSTVAVCLALLLGGCGYKLRGFGELPTAMAVTYIDSGRPQNARPSRLAAALRSALRANGIVVTEDPDAAGATLKILSENLRRRTVSASAGDEVREWTLRYDVDFAVTQADGTQLLPRESTSVVRDIIYSETQVLGRESGEEQAIQEMRFDLASAIIRRLQLVARS